MTLDLNTGLANVVVEETGSNLILSNGDVGSRNCLANFASCSSYFLHSNVLMLWVLGTFMFLVRIKLYLFFKETLMAFIASNLSAK